MRLSVYGPPRMEGDGRDRTPRRRRALALLVTLALEGQPLSRAFLVDLLWPEGDGAAGRADLSRLLTTLGRELGAGWVRADRRQIAASPQLEVDARELEAAVLSGDLAALLPRVDATSPRPLEGLSLPDAPAFDDWLLWQRERLQALLAQALHLAAGAAEASGDLPRALELARRLQGLDPLHEPSHLRVMDLYARLGQRLKAIEQYRACRRILREELGVDPSEALRSLQRQVALGRHGPGSPPWLGGDQGASKGGSAPRHPPPTEAPASPSAPPDADGEPPPVGRREELAALRALAALARGGRRQVGLILGEAGSGKTTLLRMAVAELLQADPTLLAAGAACAAVVGDGDPLHPFTRIRARLLGEPGPPSTSEDARLAPHRDALRAALGDDGPAQAPRPAEGAAEALLSGLTRLARRGPCLLWVDDLQWADRASLDALLSLSALTEGCPALLLIAARPPHPRPGDAPRAAVALTELRRRGAHTVDLDRLTPAQARAFVDTLVDQEPNTLDEAFRDALCRLTGGHALFTAELMGALRRRGDLARDAEGRWRQVRPLRWGELPRAGAVVQRLLADLPEDLLTALQGAAVAGEPCAPGDVAAAMDLTEAEAARRLGALEARWALLRPREGGGRALRHALLRAEALATLPADARRQAHRRLAVCLEASPHAEPARLSHLWEEAGEPARAARWKIAAGDAARTAGAPGVAADLYRGALEILRRHKDFEATATTLMKLGLCHHADLDFAAAHEAYAEGMRLWRLAGARPPSGPGATLRVGWREPVAFDPRQAGNFWTAGIVDQIYSGLFAQGPDVEVVPDLVTRWEIRDGGLAYRFELDPRARWSDGAPVVADDLVAAWRRLLHPPAPGCALLSDVAGAEAVAAGGAPPEALGARALGPLTLEVTMARPSAAFVHLLANPLTFPVPAHALGPGGEIPRDPARLVCNGPFRVERYQPGARLTFTARPGWHRPRRGNVARVEMHLIPEAEAQLALWEAGGLDVFRLWQLPPHSRRAARERHGDAYRIRSQVMVVYAALDPTRPPLRDARVREALALAVDKDLLVAMAEAGEPQPARGGLIPPELLGHAPAVGPGWDPPRARALLAEAGFPGGTGFPTLRLRTVPLRHHLVEALAEQWRVELSIPVELVADGAGDPPQVRVGGWTADYPDPDTFARLMVGDVLGPACPEGHREGAEAARRMADGEARARAYEALEARLGEAALILPLYYGAVSLLVKPRVRTYPMGPMRVRFWSDVQLDPDDGPTPG